MPILIVDGAACEAFRPPILRAGRAFAALSGCLARSVDRIRIDSDGVVVLTRGEQHVLFPVENHSAPGVSMVSPITPFWYFGAMYVPLRGGFEPLGAAVTKHGEVLSVQFPPPAALTAATPLPGWYPAVPRTVLFTPAPSPMPIITPAPHPRPRRTPVHVEYLIRH